MRTSVGLKVEPSSNVPPPLFRVQRELEGSFLDADSFRDEPAKEDGLWHLTIMRPGKQVEVVWCPRRGFGVSDLKESLPFTGHDFVSTDEDEAVAEAKRLLQN